MNHRNARQWVGNPVVTTVDKRHFPKGTIGILAGVVRTLSPYRSMPDTYHGIVWLPNGTEFRLGVEFLDHIDAGFSPARKPEVEDCLIAYVSAGSPRMT
jgi:hypothetical protein